ncbi:MAG: glucose-1-phosphate adenylyltransferase [Myxococcales bacterium]|nr:glucose-1-phosphate adenylyltransferase [Myxococcales bacterium]
MSRHPFAFESGPEPKVLGVVLAGGEGTRLRPLTLERAKPAVPFGGTFRIVDFVLSNLVNSGIHRIKVLTQYKSDSLLSHIARGWRLSSIAGHYVEPVPAQQRVGKEWFRGSADALYQSLNIVHDEDPDFVVVFGGDHIYRMDVRQMLGFHIHKDAALSVAAIPVPVEEAYQFGVIEVDENRRMVGFEEKPQSNAKEMPDRPGWVLASMGNYIFDKDVLDQALTEDQQKKDTKYDFGRNILPSLFPREPVYVYNFLDNVIPGMQENERGYWRDVGTLEAYYAAHMDLIAVTPVLNMYNRRWPIRSIQREHPPAKFVFADADRMGVATDSIVSQGCIVSGGRVNRSILSPGVRINSYSQVEESVLLDNVDVGRHCKVRRAIIDKNVKLPPGTVIGYDEAEDRERFDVSDTGLVVVQKGYRFSS